MKNLIWLLALATQFSFAAEFPMKPDKQLTPGELCQYPAEYRYPEQIAYCERDVSKEQADQVFQDYRKKGFNLNLDNRSSYKIDHYIPLCAGGANSNENLWPQHMSIFAQTDDIERIGCETMAMGKISQAEFVKLIKQVKNDLTLASAVRMELRRRKASR